MPDLLATVRKIERILGVPVILRAREAQAWADIHDTEIGVRFQRPLGPPSHQIQNLKRLAEDIYHARAMAVFMRQDRKCAHCGRYLKDRFETDHKTPRSKGRDDRMSNLQSVCHRLDRDGCGFHERKHGLSGRRVA